VDTKEVLQAGIIAERYEVLSLIGKGGMSVVYKARHTMMNRVVAIKMLHSQLLKDQTSIKRFQQEAQATSALSHPNLITVFDFGILTEGTPYLIMDFVQGTSLSELLDKEVNLEVDRALPIFVQACSALVHAHQKGVLHRDLKPSNIMLTESGEDKDVVKIVDFGIATFLPEAGMTAERLTQTGEVFGSAEYMSPEQCRGKKLDARSDIYAMGCVMYESLVGLPPFLGENVLDTIQRHITDPPAPFRQVRPDLTISERLERLVFRALEKKPDQRQQTMAELLKELECVRSEVPTEPMPVAGEQAKGPAAGALPVTGVTPAAVTGPVPAVTATPLANPPEAAGTPTAPFPQAPETPTAPLLAAGNAATAQPGQAGETMKIAAGPAMPQHWPVVALVSALIALAGVSAVVVLNWEKLSSRSAVPSQAIEKPGEAPEEALWKQYDAKGQQALEQSNYAEAERMFRLAVRQAEQLGEQDKRLIVSLRKLGDVYCLQEKYKDAEALDKRIAEIKDKQQAKGVAGGGAVLANQNSDKLVEVARVCHMNGQCDKAEALLKRSLQIAEQVFGPDSPQAAERTQDLAAFYLSLGMYDQAEPLFQKVLARTGDNKAAPRPVDKKSMEGYAQLLRETDRAGEAKKLEKRAKQLVDGQGQSKD